MMFSVGRRRQGARSQVREAGGEMELESPGHHGAGHSMLVSSLLSLMALDSASLRAPDTFIEFSLWERASYHGLPAS